MALLIPTVDLHDLISGEATAHARAADALREAFGTYGLVYIRNHGIDPSEVHGLYDAFLELLERPEADKRRWATPELWYQRGWTPPNTEQAVIAGGQPDFKECWFAAPLPLDPACVRWYPEVYAANIWPEGAERFRDATMEVGRQVHDVGMQLLAGCEAALDLPPGELARRCEGAAHVTRLLKYLPLDASQVGRGILWGEEHTDFNLLTLLPGGAFFRDGERAPAPAHSGGLTLRTRPTASHPLGERVTGQAPPGCIVAQVGQQLEILTAGRLLATPHEIAAPAEPGWTRTSLAHFIHLNATERVAPLPPFESDASAAGYGPPVLAGTYALKTLVDIGLAPPDALNLLGYRHYGRLASIRQAERGRPVDNSVDE